MRYGPIVAARYKRQYFVKQKGAKRKDWKTYDDWPMQPKTVYLILKELKSKEAIEALTNNSWTRRLPRTL